MEELYLSKSSIETFLQCGAKFDFRYVNHIDGVQKLEDQERAIFGNLIHDVMEDYFKSPTTLDPVALFKERFHISKVNSQKLFELGSTMISDYVMSVVTKDKIIGLEYDFKMFLDNGVPVKGFIDRINEISEEEVEIIDYKTGYSTPLTEDDMRYDIQLGIYQAVVAQMFPKYKKFKLTLSYMHYGQVSIYKSEDEMHKFKEYILAMYGKIVAAIEKGKFEPTVNSYCSFCDYKSKCSKFKEVVSGPESALTTRPEDYMGMIATENGLIVEEEKIGEFLATVKAKLKILKKIEDDTKDYIKKKIQTSDTDRVKFGSSSFSLGSKKYVEYDANEVVDIFKSKGADMNTVLSPQKTEIDKILKSDPTSLERLRAKARVKFSDSFVR